MEEDGQQLLEGQGVGGERSEREVNDVSRYSPRPSVVLFVTGCLIHNCIEQYR